MVAIIERWFQNNIIKQFEEGKKSLSAQPYIIISISTYKIPVLANMHAYFYNATVVLYISF